MVNWCQPMIEPAQEGLCAFICREINGILHFVVQSKLECGNRDIIEFVSGELVKKYSDIRIEFFDGMIFES